MKDEIKKTQEPNQTNKTSAKPGMTDGDKACATATIALDEKKDSECCDQSTSKPKQDACAETDESHDNDATKSSGVTRVRDPRATARFNAGSGIKPVDMSDSKLDQSKGSAGQTSGQKPGQKAEQKTGSAQQKPAEAGPRVR